MNALPSNNLQNNQGNLASSRSTRDSDSGRDCGFRTTNSHIFPSLHPMSKIYRERTNNTPVRNPSLDFRGPSMEATKKLRLNEQEAKVIHKAEERQLNFDWSRKSTEKNNNNSYNNKNVNKKDDYVFRVPKLPRRLQMQEKNEVKEEPKQVERLQYDISSSSVRNDRDSLVMPDPALSNYNAFGNGNIHQGNLGATNGNLSSRNFDMVPNQIHNNVQNFDFGSQVNQNIEFDHNMINSLYNNLMLQYFTFQLKQNSPSLFQICQQNQEMHSNNMRNPFGNLDNKNAYVVLDDIDERSNIKKEISC